MAEGHDDNPLQGYYEWQVTTLMLAYDLADPIPQRGDQRVEQRREQVQDEVRDLVMAILPERFKRDPSLDWPPELMMEITRATLRRAAEVAGVTG